VGKNVKISCVSLCHLKHDVCTGCGCSKSEIKEWERMTHKVQKITLERAVARLKDMRTKERKH